MPERLEAITFLEEALIVKRSPVVSIVGPPGSGKTSLALQFAEAFAKDFSWVQFIDEIGNASRWSKRLESPDGGTRRLPRLLVFDIGADGVLAEILKTKRANDQVLALFRERKIQDAVPELRLGPIYKQQVGEAGSFTLQSLRGEVLGSEQPLETGDFVQSGLIDTRGKPLSETSDEQQQIILLTSAVNEDFIRELERDPSRLYELPFRKFEELVADLLARQGYEVELTPASNDGGKDIYVARKTDLGSFLYLVECKKYDEGKPVGVHFVRALYGTVVQENATAGIIATTSRFTKGAVEFQSKVKYRMTLQDYAGIQRWIKKSLTKPIK